MKSVYIKHIRTWHKNKWTFPVALLFVVLLLTLCKVSGTSVGVYQSYFSKGKPDQSLILGKPRAVRSDEWLVGTALTVSQSKQNFPVTNKSIGPNGQDMALVMDVPYKSWDAILKPQNFSFFVLPLEYAFAFKWWMIGYLLIVSVYFVAVIIIGKRYVLAALISLAFYFSPFIQWWYQSITLLSIAYPLFIVGLVALLYESKKDKTKLLYSVAIAYITGCFLLLLYPPYMVASTISSASLLIVVLTKNHSWRQLWQPKLLSWIICSIAVGTILFGFALYKHKDSLHAYTHTAYPGNRVSAGGDVAKFRLADWLIANKIKEDTDQKIFHANQSETATFPLLGLSAIPFLIYLAATEQRKKVQKWLILSISVTSALLLLFLLRLFTNQFGLLYKLTYFTHIPSQRLWLGIGLLNLTFLITAVSIPIKTNADSRKLSLAIYGGVLFLLFSIGFYALNRHYPAADVLVGPAIITALLCSIGITLCLASSWRLRHAGAACILLFSLYTSLGVNPLYRGLGIYNGTALTAKIAKTNQHAPGTWVVNNNLGLEELPIVAGAKALSGDYYYPQLSFWKKYFPNDQQMYNRYAHVIINIDDTAMHRSIVLNQVDLFTVTVGSCDQLLQDAGVRYIVDTSSQKQLACFDKINQTSYSSQNFTIYSRK